MTLFTNKQFNYWQSFLSNSIMIKKIYLKIKKSNFRFNMLRSELTWGFFVIEFGNFAAQILIGFDF